MPMDDKVAYDSRVYTDIQGLQNLKYTKDSSAAKKEVAQQFEAMLMQMVMHSMRDANKAFASGGLFGGQDMDLYQDMFDKQMSLLMTNSNLGFAKMVETNINGMQSSPTEPLETHRMISTPPLANYQPAVSAHLSDSEQNVSMSEKSNSPNIVNNREKFSSPEDFIKKCWPAAKMAASFIGTSPEILIAQAALETNWGKNVLPQDAKNSSHNLFNIKADSNWLSKTTTVDSLEQKNGVLVKEKSNFRSYDSFDESFLDYSNFLRQNNRYSDALTKAQNPEQFINALQDAGYATDQQYANKILKIFTSQNFKNEVAKVKQMT